MSMSRRLTLVLVGLVLAIGGSLLLAAPFAAMMGDKFFVHFFWWTRGYSLLTMVVGASGVVMGVFLLLEGVLWYNQPRIILPRLKRR